MGGAGNDTMRGGEGIDCADYEAVTLALNVNLATGTASGEGVDILLEIENICAGSGNDTLVGNSVSNDIEGGLGNDIVDAGVGNDTLEGGVGNDSLLGGTGNDELMGGAGNDTMRGGEGIDCADYEAVSVALNVNLVNGTATGEGTDILLEIENICAGSGNDTLVGNSVSNDIEGGLGNDTVDAGAGNDTLEGGVGNDSLLGGAGNDEIMGGVGNDTMRGGEGIDCADYEAVAAALNVNLATGTASGEGVDILLEIENICAGSGTDTLVGNSVSNDIEGGLGNDTLDAGVGNDTLEGGVGNDSLLGGAGNDELMGGVGNDTMRGGEGIDCADYEAVSVALNVNLATGTATGEGIDILLEIENICAGSGNDTLVGNSVSNDIEGGLGNDIVDAGAGNDSLMGGLGNDTLTGCFNGANGGRSEIDAITGGVGNDIFQLGWTSGQFYDDGNAANAGRGDYVLITDFTVGQDRLQLDGAAANYYLGESGVTGVSGTGLWSERGATDELIAIIRSANSTVLNAGNTVNTGLFI
jgi:Ca2+-binding RTX toxin-like protein